MSLITIGNQEREAQTIVRDRARPINYQRHHRAITDKSEVAQRPKERKLSNNNNCLPTNTGTFEAAIHSIKITRL